MPTRWRVLIGGQALFMAMAIKFRLEDIKRGRELLLEEKKTVESLASDNSNEQG